jgi:hypothetical protein
VRAIETDIARLIADVRVLATAQLISIQNASELVGALDDMGSFLLNARRSVHSESVRIAKDDLTPLSRTYGLPQHRVDINVKDTFKGQVRKKYMSNNPSGVRHQSILSLLAKGSEFSIKDISSQLPEYSEKTVQRTLLSLVTGGKVKKTGSKRWSRYSLVFPEKVMGEGER